MIIRLKICWKINMGSDWFWSLKTFELTNSLIADWTLHKAQQVIKVCQSHAYISQDAGVANNVLYITGNNIQTQHCLIEITNNIILL